MATDQGVASTHDTEHGFTHGAEHAVAETGHGDAGHGGHGGHINLGETLPLWSCIPFACMLFSIALFPLLAPKFWHHHFGKVSAFWAACLGIPFLIAFKGVAVHEILHI
ncbi:MAG: sodium:proton antiporter, partial [Deltaproteobacteria bacterium]|nr:sodium:proton antiporter [Deltaproteobacteria bacterium]MBW1834049.1 sodium:proton antiporter [Deltaproteobacteria bacterium]